MSNAIATTKRLKPGRLLRLHDTPCWARIPKAFRALKDLDGYELAIELTHGYWSMIDPVDIAVADLRWRAFWSNKKRVYAVRSQRINGKTQAVLLHRFVLNTERGFETDHIDQHILTPFGVLDNRRGNLRQVTGAQNQANERKRTGCSSRFKGASLLRCKYQGTVLRHYQYWVAGTNVDRKRIHLGSYSTEEDAAAAYNIAHAKYYPDIPEGRNHL